MDGTERVELFGKITPILERVQEAQIQAANSAAILMNAREELAAMQRSIPHKRERASEIAQFDSEGERWRAAYLAEHERLIRYRLRGKAEHGHRSAAMGGYEIVREGLLHLHNRVADVASRMLAELQRLDPSNPLLGEIDDDYTLSFEPEPTDIEANLSLGNWLREQGLPVEEDDERIK